MQNAQSHENDRAANPAKCLTASRANQKHKNINKTYQHAADDVDVSEIESKRGFQSSLSQTAMFVTI